MPAEKYSVNQHPVQRLLTWITEKEIAIPEIQRPFVWDATKVQWELGDYDDFLEERRKLMAKRIRDDYRAL